jgi:hypothetical protein
VHKNTRSFSNTLLCRKVGRESTPNRGLTCKMLILYLGLATRAGALDGRSGAAAWAWHRAGAAASAGRRACRRRAGRGIARGGRGGVLQCVRERAERERRECSGGGCSVRSQKLREIGEERTIEVGPTWHCNIKRREG